MSSASEVPVGDATARARIRDAAVLCFGRDGARTTVRAVAAEAGVSAPLVLHHFGSKDGLRAACDAHVLGLLRGLKTHAVTQASTSELLRQLAGVEEMRPVAAYLGRSLADGGAAGVTVFDTLVADTEAELAAGEEAGRIRPTADPRMRALVLATWAMAPLLLGEHLARHLGTDGYDADAMRAIAWPTFELMTYGLLTDDSLLVAMQEEARRSDAPPAEPRREGDGR